MIFLTVSLFPLIGSFLRSHPERKFFPKSQKSVKECSQFFPFTLKMRLAFLLLINPKISKPFNQKLFAPVTILRVQFKTSNFENQKAFRSRSFVIYLPFGFSSLSTILIGVFTIKMMIFTSILIILLFLKFYWLLSTWCHLTPCSSHPAR